MAGRLRVTQRLASTLSFTSYEHIAYRSLFEGTQAGGPRSMPGDRLDVHRRLCILLLGARKQAEVCAAENRCTCPASTQHPAPPSARHLPAVSARG